MNNDAKIRELVEAAVAESIDEHLRALHDGIVARVMQAISSSLEAQASASSDSLNSAIVAIQSVSQQVDILRTLLDGVALLSARAALFILRGNTAVGWQARGFEDDDAIKSVIIDCNAGVLEKIIQTYETSRVRVVEFDSKFGSAMGSPLDGTCVLVPLIVRGKVAALLYSDSGDDAAEVEEHALELLSRAAGDWIELQALRKAAGAPAHYAHPAQQAPAHAGRAPSVAAAVAVESAASAASPESAELPATPVPAAIPPAPPAAVPPEDKTSVAGVAPVSQQPEIQHLANGADAGSEQEELHKKARRFAKLLVDEIVLYNQPAVVAGRQNHDLYDRLKEPIEKSRATFDKRYAQTSVHQCGYFNQALIAGLADHNPVVLGSNFPR